MKVLFYNHTGQVGGAERLLLTILPRLDRARFDPLLVCPAEGSLRRMAREAGVRTETIDGLHARFTWRIDHFVRYLRSFAQIILQLRRKVIEADPDLVHANSVRAGLVATVATVGLRKQIVWHIHDLLPRHPFNSLIRTIALLSRRTRMIAVAQASADRFTGSFRTLRKRVTVIPNGIDLERFHPDQLNRQKIRDEFQLGADQPVVGIVGRLTPSKGQLELLRAFKRVVSELPTATLLIAGSPAFNQEYEYAELLKQTISDLGVSGRVLMLGSRDDVAAIIQALDLLIVNSSSEACCLVILEAMACGTPVLATRTGGTPELIEHEKNGWLVPLGDQEILANDIIRLIGEADLRLQFGRQARQGVTARFGLDQYMRRVQNFYSASEVVDFYSVSHQQAAGAITSQSN